MSRRLGAVSGRFAFTCIVLNRSRRKMSRSYRHTPIFGVTTSASERQYKAAAHQRERHHVRQRLRIAMDDTDRRLHREPFGNPWAGPKDGKVYCSDVQRRDMRK